MRQGYAQDLLDCRALKLLRFSALAALHSERLEKALHFGFGLSVTDFGREFERGHVILEHHPTPNELLVIRCSRLASAFGSLLKQRAKPGSRSLLGVARLLVLFNLCRRHFLKHVKLVKDLLAADIDLLFLNMDA